MCGIIGFINSGPEKVEQHIRRLSHRGPDASAVWQSEDCRVQLGHTRLSILDLSPAGAQPMVSECGRYVIVFNGEIYNFQSLRSELALQGARFRGDSDTEVVLEAYRYWGRDCLRRFNGMFAFVIYDQGDEGHGASLFMARDRVGKKPFYYYRDGAQFRFASELKALGIRTPVDHAAVNHYLALGYVPNDLCLLQGVKKLPPAHAAVYDLSSQALRLWRYWELPALAADSSASESDLTDEAEALLFDSVRLRMISDVPLGVFLSGGMDSSLVTAAAARQSATPIKTFTVTTSFGKYDESDYARQVSEYFGTEHHVLEIRQDTSELFDELAPFVDEPLADSSIIPTFVVSKLTRQHVTVALGGDGGDELFGGYSHYSQALRDEQLTAMIPPVLFAMAGMAASLPAGIKGRNRLASLRRGPSQSIIWGTSYFDSTLRRRILLPEVVRELGPELEAPENWRLAAFMMGRDSIDRLTRLDFSTILPDDFLVKVDRASMANSLEVRAPFLDYRLAEFAFSKIPSTWKVHGGETRRIQRSLARRLLPPSLDLNRKQGFSIPLDHWLRQDRCRLIESRLGHLPGFIDRAEVKRLIHGQMAGRSNGARLFALAMLSTALENLG